MADNSEPMFELEKVAENYYYVHLGWARTIVASGTLNEITFRMGEFVGEACKVVLEIAKLQDEQAHAAHDVASEV